MRDREYALRDPRNLDKPIKVQRLDTGTGVLIPLVDNERKLVYLAGRVMANAECYGHVTSSRCPSPSRQRFQYSSSTGSILLVSQLELRNSDDTSLSRGQLLG